MVDILLQAACLKWTIGASWSLQLTDHVYDTRELGSLHIVQDFVRSVMLIAYNSRKSDTMIEGRST